MLLGTLFKLEQLIEEDVCSSFYGLLGAFSVEKLEATISCSFPLPSTGMRYSWNFGAALPR